MVVRGWLSGSFVILAAAWSPLLAQAPGGSPTIRGRVEDATTRAAIEGARIFTDDSTSVAVTDSLGHFELSVVGESPWTIHSDRFGYLSQRFDLAAAAGSPRYVLLMEPAPFVIEPLTVEVEAAIDLLVRNLAARRNSYSSAMRSMDRQWIERFGPRGGSALDLVYQSDRRLFECSADMSQLCTRGRFVTFRDPYPENRLFVCVDGWLSLAPVNELNTLPTEAVALVEVYARSQIRVYTAQYLLSRARRGWTTVPPIVPSIIPDCT
jgi:hypothetical protein